MSTVRNLPRQIIYSVLSMVPSRVKAELRQIPALRRVKSWVDVDQLSEQPTVPVATPVPESPDPQVIPIELMGDLPSYKYKLEEYKRRRAMIDVDLGLQDPLFAINDKYRAYGFADAHNVDHPNVFAVYESIDEVDWDDLPRAFVLKTRWGSSNIGVKTLVSQDDSKYLDLLRTRHLSISEIEEDFRQKADRGIIARGMFAEELILKPQVDKIADDWKFYCFDGQVGLAMQRDVRGSPAMADWRFKFWDRDWNDLGPIKFVDRLDPNLSEPRDPFALTAMAEKLSSIIGRPFLRIDLFDSARGPLLGEFTPTPGPPEVFTPEIDAMLGAMWETAEAASFAREIQAGEWSHLDH